MALLIAPKLIKLLDKVVDMTSSSKSSSSSSSEDSEIEKLMFKALEAVQDERNFDDGSKRSWTPAWVETAATEAPSSPLARARNNPLAAHLASIHSTSSRPSPSIHQWLTELPSTFSPDPESGPSSRALESTSHNRIRDSIQASSSRKRPAIEKDSRPGKIRRTEKPGLASGPVSSSRAPAITTRGKTSVQHQNTPQGYNLRSTTTCTEPRT